MSGLTDSRHCEVAKEHGDVMYNLYQRRFTTAVSKLFTPRCQIYIRRYLQIRNDANRPQHWSNGPVYSMQHLPMHIFRQLFIY